MLTSFFFRLIGGSGRGGADPDGPAWFPAPTGGTALPAGSPFDTCGPTGEAKLSAPCWGGSRFCAAVVKEVDEGPALLAVGPSFFVFWFAASALGVSRLWRMAASPGFAGSTDFLGGDFGIKTGGRSMVRRWKNAGSTYLYISRLLGHEGSLLTFNREPRCRASCTICFQKSSLLSKVAA